jgi:hypothetical protein
LGVPRQGPIRHRLSLKPTSEFCDKVNIVATYQAGVHIFLIGSCE